MRVTLLGPVEVELDGAPLALGGVRLRALVARLALDAGRVVPADRLVVDLWEEAPPADPAHALQSLVSRLRRALGDAALVVGEGGGYRLAVAAEDVDALRPSASEWRGEPLSDLVAGFAFAARAADRLEASRAEAGAAGAARRLEAGDPAGAVAMIAPVVASGPEDERAAALLMRALAADGRPADALVAYDRLRRALDDALGTSPSAATRALHAELLRGEHDPEAAVSDGAAAAPSAPPEQRRATGFLPAPVTALVGREDEVERALATLEEARLVTLVGPGGAGKTRLALAVAARRAELVRDGAWLVELAPLTDGAAIADTVMAALGRRDAQLPDRRTASVHRQTADRLQDALAGEQLLLVLDNCEHVVADAARLVDELLRRLPQLQVLTTSREALGIAGEHLLDVGPLGLPEVGASPAEARTHPAVQLFAQRAAQTSPGFRVDEDTVGPVVELCRRLDGLPLALELAAARLRTLPIHALAARLDDRFRLLTGGSRAALPRQRTLRAVVDASWELLDAPQQALARRVAVFSAGITPSDAGGVCAGAGVEAQDVADGLAALAERSLLQVAPPTREGEPRYRMLETLREYGVERMVEAGELERVRTAHAHHVAALVAASEPELRGVDQELWFHRLGSRRGDLLAALRHLEETGDARRALRMTSDLLWFWVLSNAADEATDALRVALATPGDADPVDRLVADAVVRLLAMQGAPGVDARPVLGSAHDALLAVDLRGRPVALMLLPLLGWIGGRQSQMDATMALLEREEDPWLDAACLLLLAQRDENDGEVGRARLRNTEAVHRLRGLGDRWGLAMALSADASLALRDGDLAGAEADFTEAQHALETFGGVGDQLRFGFLRAEVRMRRGDTAGARALIAADLSAVPREGDHAMLLHAALATVEWLEGRFDDARELAEDAVAVEKARGRVNPLDGHALALVSAIAAIIAADEGRIDDARGFLRDAHAAAEGTRDRPVIAQAGVAAAWVALEGGNAQGAAAVLGAAERVRGAADATSPTVAPLHAKLATALGAEELDAALAAARGQDAESALAAIAAASDPAAVGA